MNLTRLWDSGRAGYAVGAAGFLTDVEREAVGIEWA
jgi:hypothetical protein